LLKKESSKWSALLSLAFCLCSAISLLLCGRNLCPTFITFQVVVVVGGGGGGILPQIWFFRQGSQLCSPGVSQRLPSQARFNPPLDLLARRHPAFYLRGAGFRRRWVFRGWGGVRAGGPFDQNPCYSVHFSRPWPWKPASQYAESHSYSIKQKVHQVMMSTA